MPVMESPEAGWGCISWNGEICPEADILSRSYSQKTISHPPASFKASKGVGPWMEKVHIFGYSETRSRLLAEHLH